MAFACSNSIELTSAMYKVYNNNTRTTLFDLFLVSFMLTLNKLYTLLLLLLLLLFILLLLLLLLLSLLLLLTNIYT